MQHYGEFAALPFKRIQGRGMFFLDCLTLIMVAKREHAYKIKFMIFSGNKMFFSASIHFLYLVLFKVTGDDLQQLLGEGQSTGPHFITNYFLCLITLK